jgi:hypothetical protein
MSPAPASLGPCALAGAAMPVRPLSISSFQLAERLSRFLWASPADTTFLQKVTRVAPGTSADVAALAGEMLDDPRADASVQAFYRKWLALAERPPEMSGVDALDAELWASMGRETDQLVAYLTRYGGSLADLLKVPFSFLDARLGQYYGFPVSGTELRRVELDPGQRGGVLTQGSWLASHPTASRRGRWVNDGLYCNLMPPPPVPAEHLPDDPSMPLTARERQEQATAPPPCMTCHQLIDPPGFLYEHYDQVGRYRTSDNGRAVDARAGVQLPGFTGPLDGAAGLARAASISCVVQSCFAQRWLQAATGVEEPDGAALQEVAAAFRGARLGLRDLILVVVQSPLFLRP